MYSKYSLCPGIKVKKTRKLQIPQLLHQTRPANQKIQPLIVTSQYSALNRQAPLQGSSGNFGIRKIPNHQPLSDLPKEHPPAQPHHQPQTLYDAFYEEAQNNNLDKDGLAALLEVAEILSSQLDIDKLIELIMQKAASLTNADRCSLFLVNDEGDRIITSFHGGLNSAIDIPITKGIAGRTVSEGKVLNIADAYKDPSFDPSTDIDTGYVTKSILSIPIYNNRSHIIGVTEMVNKKDDKAFTEWDSRIMQIFNVFAGIALENARLYSESVDTNRQLHSFFEISLSLTKSENVKLILSDIMQNARKSIGAERSSIFILDNVSHVLTSFIADGGQVPPVLPLNKGIAAKCVMEQEAMIVNDVYSDPRFNSDVDQESGFRSKSVCCAPLISASGEILGVVEMLNKTNGAFVESDMKLLQAFAAFASVSIVNSKLRDVAELGTVEVEIQKYIGESERNVTDKIPVKLMLTEEEKERINSINFFAPSMEPIFLIKMLFYIFYTHELPAEFGLTNELLFRFIFAMKDTYHTTSYHNWIHACDVTQYVAYEVRLAHLEKVFTKFEMFALFVAAICHDASHDGFNNIYNLKAETPHGILFKDQSVMETFHCSVAISVITRDETNIFHKLSKEELKKMWFLVIKLILATDMAHHFNMVKEVNGHLDEGNFDIDNTEHRLRFLQLILKVGDISNVSRPFEYADKWCDILNEEFFRQGDLEREQGIELTSALNDRYNSNKPKSQIGFYNFICIPLYQTLGKVYNELNYNLESVQRNLEVWKSMMPPT